MKKKLKSPEVQPSVAYALTTPIVLAIIEMQVEKFWIILDFIAFSSERTRVQHASTYALHLEQILKPIWRAKMRGDRDEGETRL